MQLLLAGVSVIFLACSTSAHTWVRCVDSVYDPAEYNKWHAEAQQGSYSTQAFPVECRGYPRDFQSDWLWQSTNYATDLANMDDPFACRGGQRKGQQAPGRPAARVQAGQNITISHWGNGHSSYTKGSPLHRYPGEILLYTSGVPGKQIVYKKDLREKYWVRGARYSYTQISVIYPKQQNSDRIDEKINAITFHIDPNTPNGLTTLHWVAHSAPTLLPPESTGPQEYYTKHAPAWGTCFHILIHGSKNTDGKFPGLLAHDPSYTAEKDKEDKRLIKELKCSVPCQAGNMPGPQNKCTKEKCPCRGAVFDSMGNSICIGYSRLEGKCPFSSIDCESTDEQPYDEIEDVEFVDDDYDKFMADNPHLRPSGVITQSPQNFNSTYDSHEPPAKKPRIDYSPPTVVTSPSTVSTPLYTPNSNQCDCNAVCFHGGMKQYPCDPTKEKCPPCRAPDGGCYAKTGSSGTCPFDNAVDCSPK